MVPHSVDKVELRAVSTDMWPRRLLAKREQMPAPLAARVVWPTTTLDVVGIVTQARTTKTALVPFGAGSGVCGGISPTSTSWIVDLKRMDATSHFDPDAGTVTVGAGMLGQRLEEFLNARGFTLGHFPSSIACSTVGGWVATRSAGQLSSRYGKIEDMVLGLTAVTGTGDVIRVDVDDKKTGPGALQLLVGSEGALCIITEVKLRIRPIATHRWLRAFTFATIDKGLSAMHALLAEQTSPSVVRLYDPLDALLSGSHARVEHEPDHILAGGIARAGHEYNGPRPATHDDIEEGTDNAFLDGIARRIESLAIFSRPRATRALVAELLGRPQLVNSLLERLERGEERRPRLVVGYESVGNHSDDNPTHELHARVQHARTLLNDHGAVDVGSEPGERWLRHRHRVSYRMSKAFAAGGWVDTCETAVPWEQVAPLHQAMREALRDTAVVLCHFSHAYVDGCSLYFTFAGGGGVGTGPRSALGRYDLCWERALSTLRRFQAPASHHHGLGRLKSRGIVLSDGHVALLQSLKRVMDPDGILNPGVLSPRLA
jgi:alkyldihydroxyacetonephosphate synthase